MQPKKYDFVREDYQIVLNKEYGYHEVSPMPDKEELASFYQDKYFQDDNVIYQKAYDGEERQYYLNSIARKYKFLQDTVGVTPETHNRVLEVGMGEGYALKFWSEQGFDILGVDFSDFAVKQHNPDVIDRAMVADPDSAVEQFIEEGRIFDVLWLDNVLEHSPTPKQLLENLNKIASPNACVFIEVPNDYSMIQMELEQRNLIKSRYWEAPPEHLSYFNLGGLKKLCADTGWEYKKGIGDFPIDIFLMNEHSNYNLNPSVGKSAHRARMAFELMLDKVEDQSKVINFYASMMEIGLGREISAVFVKGK